MKAKLTLSLDPGLVRRAKQQAKRRGLSVSRMVEEYFESLDAAGRKAKAAKLPPITASLMGIAKRR